MDKEIHAVTGAFGYSGKYIAKRLIDEGHRVITITNSLDRKNPFGDGEYKMQPIYVEDLVDLAIHHGMKRENTITDAIGPETFTYRALVKTVGEIIGKRRPIISVPPGIGYFAGWIIGKLVNDVMITREEIEGLMANLLYVESPPTGSTRLTEWAKRNFETLGLKYTSELARRVDRESEYKSN